MTDELLGEGLYLIIRIKKNMKNKLMLMSDKLLVRKKL
ncbi:transposase [Spartinivicinus marinus]